MPYTIQIKKPGESPQTLAEIDTLEQARERLITIMTAHAESLAPQLDPETLEAMQAVIDHLHTLDLTGGFRAYLPTGADHDEVPTLFTLAGYL